jgi:hypothetical protein
MTVTLCFGSDHAHPTLDMDVAPATTTRTPSALWWRGKIKGASLARRLLNVLVDTLAS